MRPGDTGIGAKVKVGIFAKPVGLKGEVRVIPLTDNPERFDTGGSFYADMPGGQPRRFTVRSVRAQKGGLILYLEGVDTIDDALALRGLELYVHEDEVPPLPEGEFYYYQIIGLPVYTQSGRLLGEVADIFPAGEKDVYVVRGMGKEYLVPATDDAIDVLDAGDKKAGRDGRITLRRMKGYLPD